ncbi:MAG: TRAP transporter large permease [Desulfobacteraceae bacterium]|nr:MAG: TRAP transporter large permease [Desulfobacteraceae bacterium]
MEMLPLLILLIPFLTFSFLGMPIFISMGISSFIYILSFHQKIPLLVIPSNMIGMLDSYGFLAIPFFFLAGDLMNTGGITKRLVDFAAALVGHIKGGLSHVSIIANMIMAGVSGSAIADASATGSVLIPAMKKDGYPAAYSAAVVAAAATIGPIIPPSIPMVIYGLLVNVSIGKLFLAGAVPGFLMGLYLIVTSYLISKKRGFPARPKATFQQMLWALLRSSFAIMMPLIIILGIVLGIVTPTEAGVVAVFYALFVGIFIYRELNWKDVPRIFKDSMISSSYIMIILASSGVFSWLIASMGAGEILSSFFTSISTNKWVILAILNVFFLLWGCLLDPNTGLVVVVPMLMPLIEKLGIDPVHFGVVIILNLMIGLVTPPVGFLAYLTTTIAGAKFEQVVKESWVFILALVLALATCTFFPQIVMWLPQTLMG